MALANEPGWIWLVKSSKGEGQPQRLLSVSSASWVPGSLSTGWDYLDKRQSYLYTGYVCVWEWKRDYWPHLKSSYLSSSSATFIAAAAWSSMSIFRICSPTLHRLMLLFLAYACRGVAWLPFYFLIPQTKRPWPRVKLEQKEYLPRWHNSSR